MRVNYGVELAVDKIVDSNKASTLVQERNVKNPIRIVDMYMR